MSVDEQTIVPYILNTVGNPDLAIRLAGKSNLPGADELFVTRFNQLMAEGNYSEAAKVAARSPRGVLRTSATIQTVQATARLHPRPNVTNPAILWGPA